MENNTTDLRKYRIRGVEPPLFKYLFSKANNSATPLLGTFELTPRCNLDCKMCYVHLSKNEQVSRGNELSADTWLSIGEQACSSGMLMILLTGGEPLLRPDFREIYLGLKKMGLMISINSNGTLLNDDMIEFFRHNPPYRINISLYGASSETYGDLCGYSGGYEKTVYALKRLSELGISTKVNCSITPYNVHDVKGIVDQAYQLGLHSMTTSYMFPPLRKSHELIGCGDRLTPCQSAECKIFVDKLRYGDTRFAERARELLSGIKPEDDDESCIDPQTKDASPTERMHCRAGRSNFWITWDGRMLPCGMMEQPSFSVIELGFKEAWKRTFEATKSILMPAKCTSCDMRNYCDVCAAACYAETGSYDKAPEYLCERTREIYRLMDVESKKILEGMREANDTDEKK